MAHSSNPAVSDSFGVAQTVQALKVARGAESHFEWLVANPQAVVR